MSKLLSYTLMLTTAAIVCGHASEADARERIRGSVIQTVIVKDSEVPTDGYRSADDAAIAASNRYNPDSVRKNREHVGAIVSCGNSTFYTHGKGRSGVTPVRFSIVVPKGCALQALWHTHGGRGRQREFFSASDTETAAKLGVPFYLANYKGELRVFDPAEPEALRSKAVALRKPGTPSGAASGRIIQTAVAVASR